MAITMPEGSITMSEGYGQVATLAGLCEALDRIPGHLLKSVTLDQGSVLTVDLMPPMFLLEGHDLSVFDSLDSLVGHVEPVDAMREDFRVFDSVGRRVGLRGEGVNFKGRSNWGGRTIAEPLVPAVFEPEVLAAVLRRHVDSVGYDRFGVSEEWVRDASLQDLVGCVVRLGG